MCVGCEGENLSCLPLKWPAFAQYLDEAGVDWRSFQNSYNWATNSGLFYFQAFQEAATNSSLYQRGLAFDGDNGLDAFKQAAADGTLPEVSWAFPPGGFPDRSHPVGSPRETLTPTVAQELSKNILRTRPRMPPGTSMRLSVPLLTAKITMRPS